MAGKYKIAEIVPHAAKFACQVSFNGNDSEYYEVESSDAEEVAKVLQQVADDHSTQMGAAFGSGIQIDNKGQIII